MFHVAQGSLKTPHVAKDDPELLIPCLSISLINHMYTLHSLFFFSGAGYFFLGCTREACLLWHIVRFVNFVYIRHHQFAHF